MSAAILMTDTWQPTVLQLMPFSSNNAAQKCLPSFPDGDRAFIKSRGFPTLAVTRSRSTKNVGKPIRVSSERMPRTHPVSGRCSPPQRARSEYSSRVRGALATAESSYLASNVTRTVHRTLDLGDSVDSAECMSATDVPRRVKILPKPSPCNGFDGRYFLPQNGFWRSVTMTPGEVELQKHRIILNKEQNKCKKYKLNVNQLPRSTTPINDNDPDKLNMIQVIRFLQTRGDGHGRPPVSRKSDRRVKSGYPSTSASKVSVRDSMEREDVSSVQCALPLRREVTAVVYHSNIPTSSLVAKNRTQKPNRDNTHGEATSKSVDGNRSFKTTREFRLHRFLTMAPNTEDLSSVNPPRPIHPLSAQRRLIVTETSKSLDSGQDSTKNGYGPILHYSATRQGERYPKLQYRLPNRRSETAFHTYESTKRFHAHAKKTADIATEEVIRLPSMLDFNNESDNDDDDIIKAKLRMRDLRSMSISSECLSIEANARGSDSPVSMRDILSDSESSGKPVSRKVTVSIPREVATDDKLATARSPDPVRLLMRQGGSLTRESTYMSDMVSHRSDYDGYGLSSPFSSQSHHHRDNRFDGDKLRDDI